MENNNKCWKVNIDTQNNTNDRIFRSGKHVSLEYCKTKMQRSKIDDGLKLADLRVFYQI